MDRFATQSVCSSPGACAHVLDDLPHDVDDLVQAARDVLHPLDPLGPGAGRPGSPPPWRRREFRAAGPAVASHSPGGSASSTVCATPGSAGPPGDGVRLLGRLLAGVQPRTGQARPGARRSGPATSCRETALLVVSALRHRGVPARCRVVLAGGGQHVVASFRDGHRWVTADPHGHGGGVPAGAGWLAYRDGDLDPAPYGGGAALRDAVLRDLAHANADEVLLTDSWGPMGPDLVDDLAVIDEVASLLDAVSRGSEVAERELAERYAGDHRLRPPRVHATASDAPPPLTATTSA